MNDFSYLQSRAARFSPEKTLANIASPTRGKQTRARAQARKKFNP